MPICLVFLILTLFFPAVFCPQNAAGNADWAVTRGGEVAVGQCLSGYEGTPLRQCLISGIWNTTITAPCVQWFPDCPSTVVDSIFFPTTEHGQSSAGVCPTGYESAPEGPPTLKCSDVGQWEEAFSNPCVLIPIESNGNIANLTWLDKTSTSVTLKWDGFNLTEGNATFRIEVAIGSGSFLVANGGGTIE